jgi:transposase-like protein
MTVQYARSAPEPVTHDFCRPKCPRCGSILLIAEESAFNLRGRIRHAWACDDCSYEFVTSIPLSPITS